MSLHEQKLPIESLRSVSEPEQEIYASDAVILNTSLFKRAPGTVARSESSSLSDEFYKPIASFEGAHRYDPSFEWEEKEEKRLVRKVRMFLDSRLELPFANIVN